jgi:hypothetical protein
LQELFLGQCYQDNPQPTAAPGSLARSRAASCSFAQQHNLHALALRPGIFYCTAAFDSRICFVVHLTIRLLNKWPKQKFARLYARDSVTLNPRFNQLWNHQTCRRWRGFTLA